MGGGSQYSEAHDASRAITDCGDAILGLQKKYDREKFPDRSSYVEEVERYLEEAETFADHYGIAHLEEHDWVADEETPRVTVSREDERRPAEEYEVDLLAEAYNVLVQVRELAETFPRIHPEKYAENWNSSEHAQDVGRESRTAIEGDLKERYGIEEYGSAAEKELMEQYVDEDGEPVYESLKEFRNQLRAIKGPAEAETEIEDVQDEETTRELRA